tara:strand:- start:137 stop:304 length:168 start_codon:yes stop_codon:yes gene_type:complete
MILLGGLAVTFGGFYYGTEYRLSHLEDEIAELEQSRSSLKNQIQKLSRRVKRLEK